MKRYTPMGADFSRFMFKHSIPATAASFSIGTASADMAKTMASDLVMPVIFATVGLVRSVPDAPKFKIMPFANSMVVWLCVLLTSYVLMEYVFARGMIGVSTVVLDKTDKQTLDQARKEAAKPIEKAKKAVRDVVGGITGAPASAGYASLAGSPGSGAASPSSSDGPRPNEPDLAVDQRRSGGCLTRNTAPAEFDGTI